MKKIYLAIIFSLTLFTVKAQTGVNTKNPKGAFHVDSKKNNPQTGELTNDQISDDFIVTKEGKVGIGTITPANKLHVKDASNPLKLEGLEKDNTTVSFLTVNADGVVKTKELAKTKGWLENTTYVQGTSSKTISAGATLDVPGLTYSITIAEGESKVLLFTIQCYSVSATTAEAAQGVFSLYKNGVKVTSAFTSSGGAMTTILAPPQPLYNLPHPVTMLKSLTLGPGTHTFKLRYTAWYGTQIVNKIGTDYYGYNQDSECFLTKMVVQTFVN